MIGGQTVHEGVARHKAKSVLGAMIAMVPNNPADNGELFRRDQSELDATFSLGTVIPGEYTIVALENGWDLNWSQPSVIAHYVEKNRKITVAPTAQDGFWAIWPGSTAQTSPGSAAFALGEAFQRRVPVVLLQNASGCSHAAFLRGNALGA